MAAHHHWHLTAASPSWKLAWLNCRHISNITEPYRTCSLKPEPDLRPKMTSCSSFKVSLINSSQTSRLSEEVHTLAETLHKAMQMSFQSMRQDLANELTNVITSKADWLETMITSKKTRHE